MKRPIILYILVLLNIMVLAGQIWPAGAPPFAGVVNIVFLLASLSYFIYLLTRR
jgi:hypothetical protein